MERRHSTSLRDLETMLVDEDAEPKALPLSLLERITNGFSPDHEIGRGGSSVVYKGMLEFGAVAVKRLYNSYMYEKEFYREIEFMMKVKHNNIVRFLGYCVDTQGDIRRHEGKLVMAETQQRLLCFEYLPNGSLDCYITDSSEGLEWRMRYKIIKGICEGLSYLHQLNILHLDLKPGNILMGHNMVPKISDFGLSRYLKEKQSHVTVTEMGGTIGYLAPEFTSGVITHKFDLYSVGVIIIQILTGKRGYQDVENVLESWSNRSDMSQREQIRVCAEIGIECSDFNPGMRPASVNHIIERLAETERARIITDCPSDPVHYSVMQESFFEKPESMVQEVTLKAVYIPQREMIGSSKVIQDFSGPSDVHPPELCFLFERNKSIPSFVLLKNNTDEHLAYKLNEKSQWVLNLPICGIIPPRSSHSVLVVAQGRNTFPKIGNFLILQSSTLSNVDFTKLFAGDYVKLWKYVKQSKNTVHEVKLGAVYTQEGETTAKQAISQGIKIISIMDNIGHMFSIDANTKEPWVALRKTGQKKIATIMNYVTQEQTGTLEATTWGAASSPKFIAQREWLMAPSANDDGHIHVYNYEMEKIDALKAGHYAVIKLAVHPTKLRVLSVCWAFKEIKLWDCDDGWKLSQTFVTERLVNQVVFNPKDTNINGFAISCNDHRVELWDLDSSECTSTLTGHLDEVNCLEFFTREDQRQYLISGSSDKTAKIWDIQAMTCVHTLEGFLSAVMCVFGHPNLPVLITGTEDGIIHLWSSSDFRLTRTMNMGCCGAVISLALACPVESTRIVIGQSRAISIMDFGGTEEWKAEGEGEEREV